MKLNTSRNHHFTLTEIHRKLFLSPNVQKHNAHRRIQSAGIDHCMVSVAILYVGQSRKHRDGGAGRGPGGHVPPNTLKIIKS